MMGFTLLLPPANLDRVCGVHTRGGTVYHCLHRPLKQSPLTKLGANLAACKLQ